MIQVRANPRPFPHDGLTAANAALLLIDMQRDFLEPHGYLGAMGYDLAGVRAAIEPARRLLEGARSAHLTVIHTRQGYWPDLRELSSHRLALVRDGNSPIGQTGPLGRFLIRGEPGFALIPALAPVDGEFVVDKSGCGAFWGTDLASILAAREIRSLIFAGVTTDVCVHSTLRDATDRGFECLVAADACGSGDADAHRAALDMVTIENGVFGAVADVGAITVALRSVAQLGR
jgi:biuret amidohydrolase